MPVPLARSLRSFCRSRRQRRACCRHRLRPPLPLRPRRRSGPLACPALLAFFPLPEGGLVVTSGAESGAGRRGQKEEEAEDAGKEEERGKLLPRPAAGAPQSLAL